MIKLAYAVAVLRGLLTLAFSSGMLAAPESMMPGSSTEPAHTLLVFFVSRLLALGVAFIALAALRKPRALAGLLVADAALQVFDALWPVTHGQSAGAAVPVVIFVLELWAARQLASLTNINAAPAGKAHPAPS